MSYNMRAIIGKLNPTARTVLAEATNLANSSTHSSVEVQHYLSRLVDATNTDAERIFRESTAFIGRLAPGAVKEPGLGKEGTTTGG